MSNVGASAILEGIMEKRVVESSETLALRRWFYGEGLLTEADAEALLRANAALRIANPEFDRFLVETLCDFIVYQQRPTGRVTGEKAAWLIERIGGNDGLVATKAELDLLVALIEEAHEVTPEFAAFALAQVKRAAITGEGPAARGRVHFSRTVDAVDVELLDRLLHRGAKAAMPISRAEAEVLFEIAEACTGDNDEAWDELFVGAIAGHLVGAPLPEEAGFDGRVRVQSGSADWLDARIHSDGQVSRTESTLLAFINRRPAAQDAAARAAIIRMA